MHGTATKLTRTTYSSRVTPRARRRTRARVTRCERVRTDMTARFAEDVPAVRRETITFVVLTSYRGSRTIARAGASAQHVHSLHLVRRDRRRWHGQGPPRPFARRARIFACRRDQTPAPRAVASTGRGGDAGR